MKDIEVLPGEKCITQHKTLVCDFKIRKMKDTRYILNLRERYGNYKKAVSGQLREREREQLGSCICKRLLESFKSSFAGSHMGGLVDGQQDQQGKEKNGGGIM